MRYIGVALMIALAAQSAWSQPEGQDTTAVTDKAERDRIWQTRAEEQERFASQRVRCYARFAVNDCLADVLRRERSVLGDLRRQEILLNDAQRKRRASEMLLRLDEKSLRTP